MQLVQRIIPRFCSVPGCTGPHRSKGYCNKHYIRWRVHGDPSVVSDDYRHNWKGDGAGYSAAHDRLVTKRGRASDYVCGCGEPAAHWAYDHTCPNEKVDLNHGYLLPYSLDLDRYEPMCVKCHRVLDGRHSRERST